MTSDDTRRPEDDSPRSIEETAAEILADHLGGEEHETTSTRLGGSEELRNEVTEMTEALTLLGAAVVPVTPSAELKQRLMAQIAATPQLPPLIGGRLPYPVTADGRPRELQPAPPELEAPEVAAPGVLAFSEARTRRPRAALRYLAAAAAVAAVFVAGTLIGSTLLAPTPSQSSASAEQFAAVSAAPDAQRTVVDVAGGGTAVLISSQQLGASGVIVHDLPALSEELTYELWYIGADGPVPAGVFDVAEGSSTWQMLEGTLEPGVVVGITVEPAGGSELPTTEPIAVFADI